MTSLGSPFTRLPPLPTSSKALAPRLSSDGHSSPAPVASGAGTAENPLIPKRRRRTSPEEAKLLEEYFRLNPLPSQAERNRIAERVGMSGRAVQVWLQNRRQKEKKDQGNYAVSSNGSAPDEDVATSDLDGASFAFSSSPAPSPSVKHLPAQDQTPLTRAVATPAFLPSSAQLYASLAVNKENLAHLAAHETPIQPNLHPFAGHSASQTQLGPKAPVQHTTPTGATPTFTHRPTNATVIAAKKHIRRRPLGSHAPLARKPSLPHTFDFPPSPNKKIAPSAEIERPALRRKTSNANGTTSTGSSRQVPGLRMFAEGRPSTESDEAEDDLTEPSASQSHVQPKLEDNNNASLWHHMASDPPSEQPPSSPAPLTRKRMLAMAEQTFGSHRTPIAPAPSPTVARPKRALAAKRSHGRVPSLGNGIPTRAGVAEASRAGGEDTCALGAFERQFARLGKDKPASRSSSLSRKQGSSASLAGASKLRLSDDPSRSVLNFRDEDDEMSGTEELSFSSTATDESLAVGTPRQASAVKALEGLVRGGMNQSKSPLGKYDNSGERSASPNADEERECAELLLGLGGGFF